MTERVLEDSVLPVEVLILRKFADVIRVAPISFEVELLGDRDVLAEPGIFGLPSMIECWLPLLVTRQSLGRCVGEIAPEVLERACQATVHVTRHQAEDVDGSDPRLAYRQNERLRVLFAAAGSGEAFADAGVPDGTDEALALKARAASYRVRLAPSDAQTGNTAAA